MKATKHISIGLALLISIMFTGCGKTSNTEANDVAKLEQEQANKKAKLEREQAKNLNNQKSKKILDKITENRYELSSCLSKYFFIKKNDNESYLEKKHENYKIQKKNIISKKIIEF